MQFIVKFFLLAFVLISAGKCLKYREEFCKSKSETELQELFELKLKKYYYLILSFNNVSPDLTSVSNKVFNLNYPNHEQEIVDECSIAFREFCPHTNVEVVREDRYPFKISIAKCNCKDCLLFDDFTNKPQCETVDIVKPILVRTLCNSKMEWEWDIALEKVPVECVCQLNNKIK